MQRDVDPRQLERETEWLRSRTAAERAEMLARLWRAGRELAEVNVRQRAPDAKPAAIRWLVVELLYGTDVAIRLLGRRPR